MELDIRSDLCRIYGSLNNKNTEMQCNNMSIAEIIDTIDATRPIVPVPIPVEYNIHLQKQVQWEVNWIQQNVYLYDSQMHANAVCQNIIKRQKINELEKTIKELTEDKWIWS